MRLHKLSSMILAVALVAFAVAAQGVTIETVPVGNPGNAGELSGAGAGGSGHRNSSDPSSEGYVFGFRVVSVPEPGSIVLLASGAIGLLAWTWRRRWKLNRLSPMIFAAAVVAFAVVA